MRFTIGSCSRCRKVPFEVRTRSTTDLPPAPTTVERSICASPSAIRWAISSGHRTLWRWRSRGDHETTSLHMPSGSTSARRAPPAAPSAAPSAATLGAGARPRSFALSISSRTTAGSSSGSSYSSSSSSLPSVRRLAPSSSSARSTTENSLDRDAAALIPAPRPPGANATLRTKRRSTASHTKRETTPARRESHARSTHPASACSSGQPPRAERQGQGRARRERESGRGGGQTLLNNASLNVTMAMAMAMAMALR